MSENTSIPASATTTSSTSVYLSYEELLYLLRAMGEPNLPGMENSPWKELTDPMADVLIQVTGRALYSRRLAGPGEGNTLVIDPALQAMLHACVHPKQMLLMAYQNESQAGQHWYYKVEEFAVRQSPAAPFIFQFDLSAKTDWGWPVIEELLERLPENPEEAAYTISAEAFEKARQAADGPAGEQTPASALVDGGMPQPWADHLALAIQSAKVRLLLQYTYSLTPALQQDSLTLLADDSTCWVLNALPKTSQVTAACLPKDRIRNIIQAAHQRLCS